MPFLLAQMWNDNEWLNLATLCIAPLQIMGHGVTRIFGFMQLVLIITACASVLWFTISRFRQKKIRGFHFISILLVYPVSVLLTNVLCSQYLWTDILHIGH